MLYPHAEETCPKKKFAISAVMYRRAVRGFIVEGELLLLCSEYKVDEKAQ